MSKFTPRLSAPSKTDKHWIHTSNGGLNSCIECGSCTYVCPAKRTLVQSFRLAKKQLRGRVKK